MRILVMSLLLSLVATVVLAEDPTAGKQVEQKLDLDDGASIEYLLYLPKNYDGSKQFPFMLFLHGRGESNGPLSLVKQWGPPRLVDEGRDMPYIIASPQCPKKPARWGDQGEQLKLVRLLDHLQKSYPIDKGRMYLTGLSLGGQGAWTLAASYPDRFAAVAPICGRGNAADAEKLKDVPIWAWHGLEDTAVHPSGTEKVVNAIRELGGTKVIYTSLEGIGHNSWSAAYSSPELYSWFNRQSLKIVDE